MNALKMLLVEGAFALCLALGLSGCGFGTPLRMMDAEGMSLSSVNVLTDKEREEGWSLLWDGKTTAGWVSVRDMTRFPSNGWVIADGMLTVLPANRILANGTSVPLPPNEQKLGGGGDIVTVKKYRDFELTFDFLLTAEANSGVKYFYDEAQNGGTCEEYQILGCSHPDFNRGRNHRSASLYDVIPAADDCLLRPPGHWNSGRIIVRGSHVEHWLNGVKVVEYERGSKAFREAVGKSKYATWGKAADGRPQPWGEVEEGRILLQDHYDSRVSFRNIKIRVQK